MNAAAKGIEFRGGSLDDLSAFPEDARSDAGYQLYRVQQGFEPADWKPMTSVGKGVREIRIRDAEGAFRVFYVTKFGDVVYVLHCFQKKTRTTAKSDIDLGAKRYQDLVKELRR